MPSTDSGNACARQRILCMLHSDLAHMTMTLDQDGAVRTQCAALMALDLGRYRECVAFDQDHLIRMVGP